jgi:hypothetical protein
MVHTSFWFMVMMLIYWEKTYVLQTRKNTDPLLDALKKNGLNVNAEKTVYKENSGQNHDIKPGNKAFLV